MSGRVRAVWFATVVLAGCAGSAEFAGAHGESLPSALRPFVGRHRGVLLIQRGATAQEVAMGLDVEVLPDRPDALRWVLRYGEAPREDVRDYRLVVDDLAEGRLHIDEQNGITLAATLFAGELVSVFAVGGQTMVVRYRAVDDGVQFVLEAFTPAAGIATGGDVTTFDGVVRQAASLRRAATRDAAPVRE